MPKTRDATIPIITMAEVVRVRIGGQEFDAMVTGGECLDGDYDEAPRPSVLATRRIKKGSCSRRVTLDIYDAMTTLTPEKP